MNIYSQYDKNAKGRILPWSEQKYESKAKKTSSIIYKVVENNNVNNKHIILANNEMIFEKPSTLNDKHVERTDRPLPQVPSPEQENKHAIGYGYLYGMAKGVVEYAVAPIWNMGQQSHPNKSDKAILEKATANEFEDYNTYDASHVTFHTISPTRSDLESPVEDFHPQISFLRDDNSDSDNSEDDVIENLSDKTISRAPICNKLHHKYGK
jgi:hypothetical protein